MVVCFYLVCFLAESGRQSPAGRLRRRSRLKHEHNASESQPTRLQPADLRPPLVRIFHLLQFLPIGATLRCVQKSKIGERLWVSNTPLLD